jgi:hypothetical protein
MMPMAEEEEEPFIFGKMDVGPLGGEEVVVSLNLIGFRPGLVRVLSSSFSFSFSFSRSRSRSRGPFGGESVF